MKKLLAILMSAVIALSIAACGAEKDAKSLGGDSSTWGPGDSSKVEIPDPFVDCETLDEAKEKAGFDMIIPDAIDGYDSRKIYAIEKELISVVFVNDKDGQICFRKGVGEADVSGDFTEYAETEQVNMGGTTITLKGSDGKANLAVWAKDGYAYSISSTEEVNKVTMTDLVTTVNDDMAIGGDPSTWGPGNQADVEIPNPFTDCYTLKEAEELAGFSLKAPETAAGSFSRTFRVMVSGDMLEILYFNGKEITASVRKAPGAEDISGDNNEYAQANTVSVDGAEVTMRGNNGMVYLAIWNTGGYTYSVNVTNGISSNGMMALVSEIH